MPMKKRVVIAMSGGVDSSVAAAILKKQGFEVIGITMCFPAYSGNINNSAGGRPTCCGAQGIADARRVAHKLEIRHYVLNMQNVLEKYVIQDFCREYQSGRTPNPCVRCNQYVKFNALLKKALSYDADYLATGHYARIVRASRLPVFASKTKDAKSPLYLLKKGRDKFKDQSYFLYRLGQKQLKNILFPLGGLTKDEVRSLARRFSLPVADKLASQEICFLPRVDYRGFLKLRIKRPMKPGEVVDKYGNVLGQHKGIAFYTIGQRGGLGIAMGHPAYVTNIDYKNNRITLGSKDDAYSREFMVKNVNFIVPTAKKKIAAEVRIRYNHKQQRAEIRPVGNKIRVRFKDAQFAVTAGQSAVFYHRDTVLGGGVIERVLEKNESEIR